MLDQIILLIVNIKKYFKITKNKADFLEGLNILDIGCGRGKIMGSLSSKLKLINKPVGLDIENHKDCDKRIVFKKTNAINYSISAVEEASAETIVHLKRKEVMPMPLEVLIQYKSGEFELHYIPISLMRGEKENPYGLEWKIQPDWTWSNLNYTFTVDKEDLTLEIRL